MWYDKSKVEILDPQNWYDLASKVYSKFHKLLDNWDNWLWKKYLPRNLSWLKIVDLWSGDCRMSKYFKDKNIKEYRAVDISENMLKKCKSWITTVQLDLELSNWDVLPKNYFDLALWFFLLIHIKDLNNFFKNLYDILNNWWKGIFLHHTERRQYVYNINWKQFKIFSLHHSIKDIVNFAEYNWFKVSYQEIIENWVNIWYIILLEKS